MFGRNNKKYGILLIHKFGKLSGISLGSSEEIPQIVDSEQSNFSLAISEIVTKLGADKKTPLLLASDQVLNFELPVDSGKYQQSGKAERQQIINWALDAYLKENSPRIGDVICYWKYANQESINNTANIQSSNYDIQHNDRIGEMLLRQGVISQEQLAQVVKIHAGSKKNPNQFKTSIVSTSQNELCVAVADNLLKTVEVINSQTDYYISAAVAVSNLKIDQLEKSQLAEINSILLDLESRFWAFGKKQKQLKISTKFAAIMLLVILASLSGVFYYKYNNIKSNINVKTWLVNKLKAEKNKTERLQKNVSALQVSNQLKRQINTTASMLPLDIMQVIASQSGQAFVVDKIKFSLRGKLEISGRSLDVARIDKFREAIQSLRNVSDSGSSQNGFVRRDGLLYFSYSFEVRI